MTQETIDLGTQPPAHEIVPSTRPYRVLVLGLRDQGAYTLSEEFEAFLAGKGIPAPSVEVVRSEDMVEDAILNRSEPPPNPRRPACNDSDTRSFCTRPKGSTPKPACWRNIAPWWNENHIAKRQ